MLPALLAGQRLPAMRHLRLKPDTRGLLIQIDAAQVAHQSSVTGLPVQGIGQGRAAHDQIAEHTVVARAHGFTQVQAEIVVASQAYALAKQLQIGADRNALVALSQDARLQLHPRQKIRTGEALTIQVIQQALQVGDRYRTGDCGGGLHLRSGSFCPC